MNGQSQGVVFALTIGLVTLLGALTVWGAWGYKPPVAQAQGNLTRYVAPAGMDADDCTDPIHPCATVQYAVDQAVPGDEVHVATGVYTDVHQRAGITQTVYLSKTVALWGGYPVNFSGPPDPAVYPTTLDAQGQGRVLYITGSISPTIEGLRITGGDAIGLGGERYGRDAGGGVCVITAPAILRNNQVFGNAAIVGGGLNLYNSRAMLSDNIITANTAVIGSGLTLAGSAAMLGGNTITANTAGVYGGGLFLKGSDATFSGNTVTANTAGQGGGLFLDESAAMLSGNTVTANNAGYDGGGLVLFYSAATLDGNTIVSNTAQYNGGGLVLLHSAALLSDNIITTNTASFHGGGLYLYDSEPALNRNIIIANSANYSGGGLHLELDSNATLINNIVADNQAHVAGSGLYVEESSLHLYHTTIARNHGGDGSGVLVTDFGMYYSNVRLTNTILVSHTVGLTVTAGNTVTLEATLWGAGTWANGIDWGGAGTIVTGARNTWGDPAFADPAAGDYHIGPGSAAINAGVDTGLTTDIDGNTRPDWCFPDIGADEFITGMGCTYFYLPLALRNHVP